MLSSTPYIVILDVLKEYDVWSLKGKILEVCIIFTFMHILEDHIESKVIMIII